MTCPPCHPATHPTSTLRGALREEARSRLICGLEQTVAFGVTTNQAFLMACLRHPVFAKGEATTAFIGSHRDALVIVAEATRQGEITRGQGDAEKNRIFAEAFGQDPDFFNFYRSMNAYAASLKGENTTVILSPDSDFFRYFSQGPGAARR